MQLDETIMTISNYISVHSSSASWTLPTLAVACSLWTIIHAANANLAPYPGHVEGLGMRLMQVLKSITWHSEQIASFPGPAQLSVDFSFARGESLGTRLVNNSYHKTEYKWLPNKWWLCGWLSDVILVLIYLLEMVCFLFCSKLVLPHPGNDPEMGCKFSQLRPLPLCLAGPL